MTLTTTIPGHNVFEPTNYSQQAMSSYDDIADWYILTRSPIAGIKDVQAFIQQLPEGAKILELGCGNGAPISQLIIQKNFKLFAIDASKKMIAGFRKNLPGVAARCELIQGSDFFNTMFDAAIAWGVLFHLDVPEQQQVIIKTAAYLKPGGRFFFTSQKDIITGTSTMNGINFPYISPGNEAYTAMLKKAGMRLIDEHFDRWGNYIYIAEKHCIK